MAPFSKREGAISFCRNLSNDGVDSAINRQKSWQVLIICYFSTDTWGIKYMKINGVASYPIEPIETCRILFSNHIYETKELNRSTNRYR